MELALVLLAALLVDAACGDPASALHPVRLMGRWALWLERRLRRLGLPGRAGGIAFTLFHVTAVVVVFLGLRRGAALVHAHAATLLDVVALYSTIGFRSLFDHLRPISTALEAGDLPGARRAVQRIVGRDADRLDATGVARAAVESASESFVDGFFAPLCWYVGAGLLAATAGVPPASCAVAAALAYRATNTLDSMVGHRNRRYRRFGWASARLDDGLNWLPARLSVVPLTAAALLTGRDAAAALRCWRRDRLRHPSPNGGHSESLVAGALDLRLGGPAVYRHGVLETPWIGDGRPAATAADLQAAGRLLRVAGWLAGLAAVAGLALARL